VKEWWESLTSPTSAIDGVGRDFECFYRTELFHFHFEGDKRATGREIEQELSRIRPERRK
jgi:hypothetical protein